MREQLESYCIPKIVATIDNLGGLDRGNVVWSQPFANLDRASAWQRLDHNGRFTQLGLTDFSGLSVLCLASGGGQQSVLFGLLGAAVTILDLTPAQLARDEAMALAYGYAIKTVVGDMRDLSALASEGFDLVYQPYAINFVPDPLPVLAEAARVLRPGGIYYLQFANPLWNMEPSDWTGRGYPILLPYKQGQEVTSADPYWDVEGSDGTQQRILGPREFVHTLGTLINGLGANGMSIIGMDEGPAGDPTAEAGSWEHLLTYLPVWPAFWSRKHGRRHGPG